MSQTAFENKCVSITGCFIHVALDWSYYETLKVRKHRQEATQGNNFELKKMLDYCALFLCYNAEQRAVVKLLCDMSFSFCFCLSVHLSLPHCFSLLYSRSQLVCI